MKWPWQRHNESSEARSAVRFAAGDKRTNARDSRLFEVQAVDQMMGLLGVMPEVDEILTKAGKSRCELRKLTGDDEIATAMETRLTALLSVPWRLDPYEDDPVAVELWALLEPHVESIIRAAWDAVPFGYSVFELVYARADRIGIGQVRALPFEWFTIDKDWQLRYRRTVGTLLGEPVDEQVKFFRTVRNATVRQPTGDPLLSKVFWPWFFRTNGWKFWATFLERHGSPFMLGKTAGDVQKMADALVKMVQAGVAAVGKDDSVEATSPGNAGDAFDKFSTAVDKRIQKVWLGQTLTTDVQGGGSYAASKTQDLVRKDRLHADIRLVTPTVQRVVNALCWLNFPSAKPPTFCFEAGDGLGMERAKRDQILSQAGVKFKPSYWVNRYDFEEDEIDQSEPPPPPVPPQGRSPADLDEDEDAEKFSARYGFTRSGKAGRFTADQEALEGLVGSTLAQLPAPVSASAIRATIKAATGPDDLIQRLGLLFADADDTAFRDLTERALFAADVMGYAASEDAAGGADSA